eukprot:gene2413-2980_t
MDTRDEFDLGKLNSLIDKQLFISSSTVEGPIDSIQIRTHITLVCNVLALILICLLFIVVSLTLLNSTPIKREEEERLLSNSSSSLSMPPNLSADVRIEGTLFEPWNTQTIEKMSSDESPPFEKIKTTYYRYGITAGKILYERFQNQLTPEENKEISWMLGNSYSS